MATDTKRSPPERRYRPRAPVQGLTERQSQILRLVASGAPSKAIAAKLSIGEATLKRDIRAIFNYLGTNDRAHAVAEGFRRGLLS